MKGKKDHTGNRPLILFSSLLRWALGLFFIILGFREWGEGDAWAFWLFGILFVVTSFFRPKRCLEEPLDG